MKKVVKVIIVKPAAKNAVIETTPKAPVQEAPVSPDQNEVKETVSKVKSGLAEVWDWTTSHKEDLMWVGGILCGLAAGVKKLTSSTQTSENRYRSDNTYYDRHTGTRWWLRRPLTNMESAELVSRCRMGEHAEDVLFDMGVLEW